MGQPSLGSTSDTGGVITKQGNPMKLFAITLAAAGLLAAPSAQAELQTWRFSGLIMDASGTLSPSATYGEYAQFDLTFDTDAAATGDTFSAPLLSLSIDGASVTLGPSSLQAGTYASLLSATLPSDTTSSLTSLMMRGAPATDGWTQSPVKSVGEFLSYTDMRIEDIDTYLVSGAGLTWQEAVTQEYIVAGLPYLQLSHQAGGFQTYALIGAANITPGVPEPSAWALALLGGVGAAALARRRQCARGTEALSA